jgi:hypothetical protein
VAGSNSTRPDPPSGTRPGRCHILLGCLAALLVAFPFLEDVARPLILIMPIAAVFLAGVAVVDSSPYRLTTRAAIIAAVQIALTVVSLLLREAEAPYLVAVSLGLIATTALIFYAIYCILRYVLEARVITRDQIYAGIDMYLMLGFAFGAVFYLVNILDPNSFISSSQPLGRDTPDLIYFSFVTLATLGYGDISPRSNIARSLSVVEALCGMLFIAIFMARLVSMRGSDEPPEA